MPRETGRKLIAQNKKARHDYSILDTYEVGLVLTGTEVKSLRAGRASLVDGFATVDDGEVWLRGLHLPEYTHGTWTNHEPRRTRKLLLHRGEIERLIGTIREGGLTLVPLALYFRDGKVKLELALARGKRDYDKRQDLAKRDADREISRVLPISRSISSRCIRSLRLRRGSWFVQLPWVYSGMCRPRSHTSPSSMVAKASTSEARPSRRLLTSVPISATPAS